jgi:enamine deaminase RidA (YjgF/YER057c/UK114 family)
MPKKKVIQVNLAAANPNLSPTTRFGNLVFVAGQTGRHPITGRSAEKFASRPATPSNASR